MPDIRTIAWAMSEDEVEAGVRALIKSLGLLGYHPWKQHARRASAGFPDWVIAGAGGVLFRELKKEGESPTPQQQQWLATLTFGGSDAGVWYPTDLLSGRIARELAAITHYRDRL